MCFTDHTFVSHMTVPEQEHVCVLVIGSLELMYHESSQGLKCIYSQRSSSSFRSIECGESIFFCMLCAYVCIMLLVFGRGFIVVRSEYDAMAVEDVRRKAWMMNGPFSLYRNNEFGREHWTKIDREVLVSKLTNPHVSYVDEQTSSCEVFVFFELSFIVQ